MNTSADLDLFLVLFVDDHTALGMAKRRQLVHPRPVITLVVRVELHRRPTPFQESVLHGGEFLGAFAGGLIGGRYLDQGNPGDVFFICVLLAAIWLALQSFGRFREDG